MNENLLTDNGWVMYYECFCRGNKKKWYKNNAKPDYEVRLNTTRKTFSILMKNHVIHGPNYQYNMEKKLKEYELI